MKLLAYMFGVFNQSYYTYLMFITNIYSNVHLKSFFENTWCLLIQVFFIVTYFYMYMVFQNSKAQTFLKFENYILPEVKKNRNTINP